MSRPAPAPGRDVLGREHPITFVFAVFLVDEADHAAGGKRGR
jgi:hypothetical protein